MLLRTIPAVLLLPLSATAQIAPDALWQSWQGTELPNARAAEVQRQDGSIRLEDLILHLAEGLSLETDVATLDSDGQSVVIWPGETLRLSYETASGAPIPVEIQAPGATIRVSGTPEAPNYALAADSLTATSAPLATTATLFDLGVSYATDGAPPDLTFEAGAMEVAATVPTEGGRLEIDTEIERITGGADLPAPGEAIVTLVGQESLWRYAGAALDGPMGDIEVEAATQTVDQRLTLSETGLDLDGVARSLRFTATGPEVPLTDATARIARLETSATGPLPDATGPQPASLDVFLTGLTASDEIWGLFDPEGVLPRDPAALSLTTTGRLAIRDGEIRPISMVLTSLEADGLGISLSGQGDAIFEEGADGRPRPVGQFDLRTTGFSDLLTTLADIGAIPPAQALGARIALMTLTNAQGDDVRTTPLTFAPDGTISLNDQPVARLPSD